MLHRYTRLVDVIWLFCNPLTKISTKSKHRSGSFFIVNLIVGSMLLMCGSNLLGWLRFPFHIIKVPLPCLRHTYQSYLLLIWTWWWLMRFFHWNHGIHILHIKTYKGVSRYQSTDHKMCDEFFKCSIFFPFRSLICCLQSPFSRAS